MATAPIPVKQAAQTPIAMPDFWPPFRLFRTEMDRLFDRFSSGLGMVPFPAFRFETLFGAPSPAVDITEDDASVKLSAELPGISEKDIQVSLSGDTLTIKGEKRQQREERDKNCYLTERSYGEFQRSFLLPAGIDRDKITASFANGVLTVTAFRVTQAASKKIEVKAAA